MTRSTLRPVLAALAAGALAFSTFGAASAASAEACGAGFWRQAQHLASWPAVVAPDAPFHDFMHRHITIEASPGVSIHEPTMLEALGAKGSGVNRIARVGAAAYLSARHSGVAFPYGHHAVHDAVQAAIDGVHFRISIDDLEAAIDGGSCPLP